MRLIKVYSNKNSFKTVEFNKTGLNFILAKQKKSDSDDIGRTYNGVGKSLLIRIIHFCLGASLRNYKIFCEKLSGWEFYVDYEINERRFTAKRSTDNPKKITLNNVEISVNKFNEKMKSFCFNIPENISFLSFRSLLPFFIRPKKESYMSYFQPSKSGSQYQSLLNNAFLLGLDVDLAQRKYKIRKEQERIKKLEKNFKEDSLLRDYFTGNKDVTLTLVDLEERIKKLDTGLKNFEVAEDYKEVQLKADAVEKELFDLNNKIIMIQNNINNIDKSLKISPDMNKEDMIEIYDESKIYFSDILTKTLEDLEKFYEKLITNRKRRLLEQQNKLKQEKQNKELHAEKVQDKLDAIMQYLGKHQALDLYANLSKQKVELETKRDSLKKYQELKSEYKNEERECEKRLINQTEITEEYLEEIKPETSELRDYFRRLAKIFYPDSVAGLTIDSNNGENQLRFSIDAKIESDASDGINHVKIFCYDLTLLFKGYNHNIDFIFHDSRILHGIDPRQIGDLFKNVYNKFSNSNKQYILTLNQNQLDEAKQSIDTEEIKNIFNKESIVLTLTDDSDESKLLGVKVEI